MSETKDRWTGTLTVTYGDGGVHGCLGCRRVGTPAEIAEHVLTCPQHPIGRLTAERDALLARLAAREPISHAEFARFVQEAREQRERADALETERDRLAVFYQIATAAVSVLEHGGDAGSVIEAYGTAFDALVRATIEQKSEDR